MSSNRAGARRAAVLIGALAVLAVPAAVVAAQVLEGVELLRALYVGVPAAFALGLIALAAARRARFALERSITPSGAAGARTGRVLAWAGIYAGITGAVAIGVYWALRLAE
jgi:hypothetical protein